MAFVKTICGTSNEWEGKEMTSSNLKVSRTVRLVVLTVGLFSLVALGVFRSTSARAAENGHDLFKAKCSMCHGEDGSGNTPIGQSMKARDLASPEVQAQSDQQLSDIIRNGKGKMPAVGKDLSDEQVRELVAFLRKLAKKRQ